MHAEKLRAKSELSDLKKYTLTFDKECANIMYKGFPYTVIVHMDCAVFIYLNCGSTVIKNYIHTIHQGYIVWVFMDYTVTLIKHYTITIIRHHAIFVIRKDTHSLLGLLKKLSYAGITR